MFKFGKKRVLALAAVAALAVCGIAYAYWTTSGSGTGSATTGDVTAIKVNQTNAVSGLYPGGLAQAVSGNFDNGNSGKVYIASVTAEVTGVTMATPKPNASAPDCTTGDFAISGTSNTPGEIDPGNGKGAWNGLKVALTDNATANQDNCKNASIEITYTANAS
jgi:hypothetical protein